MRDKGHTLDSTAREPRVGGGGAAGVPGSYTLLPAGSPLPCLVKGGRQAGVGRNSGNRCIQKERWAPATDHSVITLAASAAAPDLTGVWAGQRAERGPIPSVRQVGGEFKCERERGRGSAKGVLLARGGRTLAPRAPRAPALRGQPEARGERRCQARPRPPARPARTDPASPCAAGAPRGAPSQTQARQRGWHRWGSRGRPGALRAGADSAGIGHRDTCGHR